MICGSFERLENYLCAGRLISLKRVNKLCNLLACMDVCASAATDDAFFNCRSGSCKSILHTKLGFLHLSLGSCAYTDNCYAACKLCKSLLKLLLVEIRSGFLYLLLYLIYTGIYCGLLAFTVNDDCILLLNLYALCTSKLLESGLLKLKTKLRGDNLSTGKDCDIFKHCLSSVAISGSLYSYNLEGSSQGVYDEGCQSLALYILCDDEKL